MNGLDLVIHSPLSKALGWTVLHSLWEGAIIAVVLAVVLASTRSARVRYGAACVALLAILAGFVFTLASLVPENYGPRVHAQVMHPVWRDLFPLSVRKDSFPGIAMVVPWLAPVWACGVFVFYCRYAAGWLTSHKLRSRGVCKAPTSWQLSVTRWTAELKISRPVLLLESLFAEVPMVIGHFRPVILVPLGFLSGLSQAHVEAILLHELAHISRSDYLVNVYQCLIEGLLFYHPAVWWISRVICSEREHCCDDIAVARRGNARQYAEALAALERNRLERWSPRQAVVAANGGNLMKRIRRLLYPKGPRGIWAPAMVVIVLTVSSGITFAAWHLSPNPQSVAEESSNGAANSWQKWLNEDVVYLISDEEKAAFERLTSDEERQQFVEQFWARRDPTPGTPENEFKKEHYRRLAFANKHFRTTSGTPGWQTDRGHIYILYGPPDEIDSHPKKQGRTYGVEDWKYNHVEGVGDDQLFTFFDRTGGGDYRLGPANHPTESR